MSSTSSVLNSNEAKARIRAQGITITQWSAERGFSRQEVYRVLNGQLKANFGRAHDIAVALGMKQPLEKCNSPTGGRNLQEKVA